VQALHINLERSSGSTLQRLAGLIDGQTVRAVVSDDRGNGAFKVRIGSISLEVQSEVALGVGERLELVVSRTGGKVQLSVVEHLGTPNVVRFMQPTPQPTPGAITQVTVTRSPGSTVASVATPSGPLTVPLSLDTQVTPGSYLVQITGVRDASGFILLETLGEGSALLVPPATSLEAITRFALGERITAVALTETSGPDNTLRVALANSVLELRANFHIAAGTHLALEVARFTPRVELRLLAASDPAPPGADAIRADLLRAMPKQVNLQAVVEIVAELAARKDFGQQPAANRLLALVPDLSSLASPQVLVQKLAQSGTRLESNLAHAKPEQQTAIVAEDMKASLLKLSQVLAGRVAQSDPADQAANALLAGLRGALQPGSLFSEPVHVGRADLAALNNAALLWLAQSGVESALARLTTLQLQHVMSNTAPPALLTEVPVRFGENVGSLRVRIRDERKTASKPASERAWSAEIRLDLANLPDFRARISVLDKRVNVVLDSDHAETRTRLFTQRDLLLKKLAARELAVVGVSMGRVQSEAAETRREGLLDVHA